MFHIEKLMLAEVAHRMRLKAVVAVPPVKDFYFTRHRFSSLGARTVFKLLKANGIDAVLLDFPTMKKHGQQIDIPDEIAYLKGHIVPGETGKLSYFTKYQIFGPSAEECAGIICSHHPALCFLSCFAFSYSKELLDLARNIKKLNPGIVVATGGAGVTAYPHYFLRDASIDFALGGEAEVNLRIFLDAVTGGVPFDQVPNLMWKQDGVVLESGVKGFSESTMIEPLIAKVWETRRSVYYSTCLSRGCPNGCRFCSNGMTHGTAFRTVAAHRFLNELEDFAIDGREDNRRVFLNFEDDNLLLAPEYLIDVMTGVRNRLLQVSFLAENGVDFRLLTPALADRLVSLGLASFNFTLGSVSENILEQQKRTSSLSHYESITRYIAAKKIQVLSYFIVGLEGDSKRHSVDTMAFLSHLPTTVGISMFYAVPGIYGFKNLEKFDTIAPCICNGSSAYHWNSSLSTEELVTIFRLSRYVNLLKSERKSPAELQLIKKIRNEERLFTLVKNGRGVSIVEVPCYDRSVVRLLLRKINPEA